MAHKKSTGLKGGPNEYITDISEFVSIEGYKRNSPDVNNPYNIIESGNITMEGVDFPVRGYGNNGMVQDMIPGVENYDYGNADYVVEVPIAKRGGGLLDKTMKCNSCGWEWKAADGGSDIDTCHKCGSKALPKAQEGTEVEEKSVWGFVKEMAKVPGANISNLLGVMGIPANLIAEATESVTGRGDGEFNFMDAMPSFATPGSDDEIFTFTNQNDTPVKNVAGLEDAEGNPLVENSVGAFITNLATDPSTYVGAGVAKNLTKKIPNLFSKQIDNFKFKNLPTVDKKQFMKVVDGEFDTIDYDHLIPTTQEISDLATKTRSRLLSAKFIKNNMEATGRSKDEVVSYIDDYIKEFENSTLAFDKTPGGSAGLYTRGKITIDPRNPHLTKENVLGTLEHEIEHMFSNVGQQGSDLYRHPKFKLVDRTGMPDENLVQNMGQAFEQQVRFRKALGWLEKNAGLKVGDNVTDEQVEALTDAIANWSKEQGKDFRGTGANFDIQYLFSSLDAEQFLKPGQYLMPNAPRTANLKNSNVRQGIKDILNKTYTAAAIGGLGAASQMGPEQEDGQYTYGGSPSKAQVGLETGDYIVEDGDTFYGIANKNNISWKDLVSSNPSVDINRLSLGDTLQVPGYKAPLAPEEIAVKQNTYNAYAPTNELATQRRADLDSALNTVVGASDNNMNLRTLLFMTGAMENNWGNAPDAYTDKKTGKPRTYTRGMMSIDDNAYKDLFEPRGNNGRFVDNQKKMFEWLKGIGLDYTQMNDMLRSNDPLAGMAAARMQYARRPEPLPDGNDPDAVYEYYMKHYNRTGADHKERFMGNWNEFIKRERKENRR